MNILEMLPNIVAMISSLIAIFLLYKLTQKVHGGSLEKMVKLLSIGIFFSVFIHAGFELAEVFGFLSIALLRYVMGGLISIGSICFIIAAWIGLKSFE
ncbi:MAG: hypothetical protein D6675_12705 [Gemmatimonadetes bacterium]|nr:MAG: hypothetical protein D6675_12705 [Gemmatimonadota bacterium]